MDSGTNYSHQTMAATSTPTPTEKRKLDAMSSNGDDDKSSHKKEKNARNLIGAMELLMMHLKRCKYLLPKEKRLRNYCLLCPSNEDGSHVSSSGVRYDDISIDEWKFIHDKSSEQSLGMATILSNLGTMNYIHEPYTLNMLKEQIELHFCRSYKHEYTKYYLNIGRGGLCSSKEFGFAAADENLMVCAKTHEILDTFKSILTLYGDFPKDVHRRFIRHPSAPQYLWPVIHCKSLAFVEIKSETDLGKRRIVCIGEYCAGDVELATLRIPDLLTMNAKRTSKYDYRALSEVRITQYQEWLRRGNIPYVFNGIYFDGTAITALPMLEDEKTEEFTRQEKLVASCIAFNDVLTRLDLVSKSLRECYTDKFNDVSTRHDQVKLTSDLMTLTKELSDLIL